MASGAGAGAPLLEARRVSKTFPGVRALSGVDLRVDRGEVLALVGENGAGKSTLMKVLAGVLRPDSGQVLVDGRAVEPGSVPAALAAGVALLHQELNLAGNLDVAANVLLGREPRRRGGWIDFAATRREAARHLAAVGLDVDPRVRTDSLSIGRQQLVEIAKALAVQARVLIMDEPTSSLSARETERLFGVVRGLRARGVGVVYISHRLGEVRALADRVCVLRDGASTGELRRDEVSHDALVRLMVGRDVSRLYRRTPRRPGAAVLEVDGLRTRTYPACPLSFRVRAGEIVGLAGLVGAGRTELLLALFGVVPAAGGRVRVAGRELRPRSPRDAIRAGIALVPEDRKRSGLVLEMAVRENLSLAAVGRDARAGFLDRRREGALARGAIGRLSIRTPSERQAVRLLSGGNQQKVVLGKWLAMDPTVLLLDEPTRGVDVGAKEEIYGLVEELARGGVGVLFVSSEMEEVLGVADRALVMHEGRIAGELGRDGLSEEAVMRLATGRPAGVEEDVER